jgi:uncharacterized protein with PIN domain
MTPDRPTRPARKTRLEQPALSQALVTLAEALDARNAETADAPSYLELAILVARLETQLDDLSRLLVHLARRHEQTSWQDIGDALGVTRQTAYKRFGAPSPNDPEAES